MKREIQKVSIISVVGRFLASVWTLSQYLFGANGLLMFCTGRSTGSGMALLFASIQTCCFVPLHTAIAQCFQDSPETDMAGDNAQSFSTPLQRWRASPSIDTFSSMASRPLLGLAPSTHYLRVCCLQLSTLFQCPRVLGLVRTVLAVSCKVLALSQSEQVWTVELHFHLVSGRNVDYQAPGEQ